MATRAISGANYHWRSVGEYGHPLVLLHGFTGSKSSWSGLDSAFRHAGYALLIPDLLGHGDTDAPSDPRRYRMEAAAADLVSLIARQLLPPFSLIGYSMGARLALYLALTYPSAVDALVLESGSPGLADPKARDDRRASDEELANWIMAHGITAFVDRWQALPLWHSQRRLSSQQQTAQRAERLGNRPIGLANSLRGMGTGAQPSMWHALPTLHTPTLLITGAEDRKFCDIAAEMMALLPAATHQIIPNAGHNTHLEQPDAFIATFEAWQATLSSRPRLAAA